jgi:hypothetical protein
LALDEPLPDKQIQKILDLEDVHTAKVVKI